jgi:hypothetical protein
MSSSRGDLLNTWRSIEQTATRQIITIKTNAARSRIQTPLVLDQAQYSACFGYITTVALRKAHANFTQKARPFNVCTGAFTRTTGLPCAHHIDDIRVLGVSLLPSDFHRHWYWDRYTALSEPTLEPIKTVTSFKAQRQATNRSTKRIPSAFEATEPRERRCGQCRLPGHTCNSPRCMHNIKQMQQELARESDTRVVSTTAMLLDFSDSRDLYTNSQLQPTAHVALQSQSLESRANTMDPEVDTRPIWPGRPELIYQAYLAEKEAWLAANPTVLPLQYRHKRGLPKWSESWCRQNKKFLPYQRLNLQSETLILGDPNWSYEELRAWLDWDQKKQEEADQEAEAELIAAGGFGRVRQGLGLQGGMNRISREIVTEKRDYRFS